MGIQNCEQNSEVSLLSSTITFKQPDGSQFSLDERGTAVVHPPWCLPQPVLPPSSLTRGDARATATGILAQRAIYFVLYLVLTAVHLLGMYQVSRTGSVHLVRGAGLTGTRLLPCCQCTDGGLGACGRARHNSFTKSLRRRWSALPWRSCFT